jgi:hypothetical protein
MLILYQTETSSLGQTRSRGHAVGGVRADLYPERRGRAIGRAVIEHP